jgi:hypothetical protein
VSLELRGAPRLSHVSHGSCFGRTARRAHTTPRRAWKFQNVPKRLGDEPRGERPSGSRLESAGASVEQLPCAWRYPDLWCTRPYLRLAGLVYLFTGRGEDWDPSLRWRARARVFLVGRSGPLRVG